MLNNQPLIQQAECQSEDFKEIQQAIVKLYINQKTKYMINDVTGKRTYEQYLEDIAFRDELTGIYNRRYGRKVIDDLMDEGIPFVLCFIDIDYLKVVNDQYGHIEGDSYIQIIISNIYEEISKEDILCRQGGDEFIIIMPRCTEKQAASVMRHICNKLNKVAYQYPLSISHGSVEVQKGCGLTYKEIIQIADQRMYAKKKENHRQIVKKGLLI